MSLAYIRDHYKVPARRGGRVLFALVPDMPTGGQITGSSGSYVRVLLDGDKHSSILHPTWRLSYLGKEAGR